MQLDTLFIKVMKEMVDNGQMVNGNFKPGAYPQMEKMMEVFAHEAGIKADPHLRSRHKTLKKQYVAVQLLKSQSGYGWNDEMKCPDIEDGIYNDFVKVYMDLLYTLTIAIYPYLYKVYKHECFFARI
ncbi:hypothetical protein LINPERHAP1_LOCUS18018 [Linum perenne]